MPIDDPPEFLARRRPFGRQHLGQHPVRARAQPVQDLGADALALAGQAEQDVLGADVAVTEPLRLAQREFEHLLGARGERDVAGRRTGALPGDLRDLLPGRVQADLEGGEGLRRHPLALGKQAEQDVLGADVAVAEHPGFLLGQDHDPARLVGEPFEHLRTPRDCMGAVQEA